MTKKIKKIMTGAAGITAAAGVAGGTAAVIAPQSYAQYYIDYSNEKTGTIGRRDFGVHSFTSASSSDLPTMYIDISVEAIAHDGTSLGMVSIFRNTINNSFGEQLTWGQNRIEYSDIDMATYDIKNGRSGIAIDELGSLQININWDISNAGSNSDGARFELSQINQFMIEENNIDTVNNNVRLESINITAKSSASITQEWLIIRSFGVQNSLVLNSLSFSSSPK